MSCNPSRMWQEGKWCQVCISGGWLLISRLGGGPGRRVRVAVGGAALRSERGNWVEVVWLGEGPESLGWAWVRPTDRGMRPKCSGSKAWPEIRTNVYCFRFCLIFKKSIFFFFLALIIGCKFYSEPPLLSQRYICTAGWPVSYLFLCFLLEYSWFTVLC